MVTRRRVGCALPADRGRPVRHSHFMPRSATGRPDNYALNKRAKRVLRGIACRTRRSVAVRMARPAETSSRKTGPFDCLAYDGRIKHGLPDVLHAATATGSRGRPTGRSSALSPCCCAPARKPEASGVASIPTTCCWSLPSSGASTSGRTGGASRPGRVIRFSQPDPQTRAGYRPAYV